MSLLRNPRIVSSSHYWYWTSCTLLRHSAVIIYFYKTWYTDNWSCRLVHCSGRHQHHWQLRVEATRSCFQAAALKMCCMHTYAGENSMHSCCFLCQLSLCSLFVVLVALINELWACFECMQVTVKNKSICQSASRNHQLSSYEDWPQNQLVSKYVVLYFLLCF